MVPSVVLGWRVDPAGAAAPTCISGGGETGGEKVGELKADALGGGDVTKLGVVLPEPKNISLEGVPLAETEDTVAAGLYTTESVPLTISALRCGASLSGLSAVDDFREDDAPPCGGA